MLIIYKTSKVIQMQCVLNFNFDIAELIISSFKTSKRSKHLPESLMNGFLRLPDLNIRISKTK